MACSKETKGNSVELETFLIGESKTCSVMKLLLTRMVERVSLKFGARFVRSIKIDC